jgi:hypothetical protein
VAAFELVGALAEALPVLAVGPWRPARQPELMAFAAGEAGDDGSLWRVALDAGETDAALANGERSVRRVHAALDGAPALAASAGELAGVPAFAASAGELAGVPASAASAGELAGVPAFAASARELADVPAFAASARELVGAPAFPAGDGDADAGMMERLGRMLERMADGLRGRARIETWIAGVLVARSVASLGGDAELCVVPAIAPEAARLHARSVAVAVASRDAWAKTLALVIRYASQLAALGPHAGVRALPIAWRLVCNVLHASRDHAA